MGKSMQKATKYLLSFYKKLENLGVFLRIFNI
jgi:hypothetical protein